MDTIGAAISGGDDTEIDENDFAAIAAAASLFGVSIGTPAAPMTTRMATSAVMTTAAAADGGGGGGGGVGFIGSSEPDTADDGAGGNGPMDDLDGMDSIDGMDGFVSVSDQDLDDMGVTYII